MTIDSLVADLAAANRRILQLDTVAQSYFNNWQYLAEIQEALQMEAHIAKAELTKAQTKISDLMSKVNEYINLYHAKEEQRKRFGERNAKLEIVVAAAKMFIDEKETAGRKGKYESLECALATLGDT